MECPNCGNEVYERLDYAIVQCTQCMSLWDPFVYPGFPRINVGIGELWDTSERDDDIWLEDEYARGEELDDLEEEEDDEEGWDLDKDTDFEDEGDDWDDEEEDEEDT